MPSVFNKHTGYPPDAIYIGRGSLWGNPFKIGKDGSREEVVEKYKVYLQRHPEISLSAKQFLRGKNLVCFCAPRLCHGELLLEIANAEEGEGENTS